MLIFVIILIVLLVLIIPLFCSVRVYFSFKHLEGENRTDLEVKYLFFNKALSVKKKEKTETKKSTVKPKKDIPENGIKYFLDLYKEIKEDVLGVLNYLTKRATVFENIKIKVDFGFSNTSNTGIMTGTLNGVLYNIMAYFHNNFTSNYHGTP